MEDAFLCVAGVAQACKPCEGFGTIAALHDPEARRLPGPFSV
jgi:hypothetical protein